MPICVWDSSARRRGGARMPRNTMSRPQPSRNCANSGTASPSNVARRCLARLVARQRKGGEAREMLHDALLRNPHDDATMRMLADLYLEGGDDPAVAEALARRSLLQHECAEGWRLLSRALAAQGKTREADEAAARASVL